MAFRSHCVSITDAAEEHDASGDRFINYLIEIDWRNDKWNLKKRYSDFERFQKKLVAFYGKSEVPQLTGKRSLKQFSAEFISKRKKKLQTFLSDTVDNIPNWKLKESEKCLSGPGKDIGVNPVLYIFLEFERNISKSLPPSRPSSLATIPGRTAGGGLPDRRATIAGGSTSSPLAAAPARDPSKSSVTIPNKAPAPLAATPPSAKAAVPDRSAAEAASKATAGLPEENFEEILKRLDEDREDEDKLSSMTAILEEYRSDKRRFILTCAQAKEIASNLYFGDTQLEMCKKLLKTIVDPENREYLFEMINFDDDEEELNILFDQGRI